MAASLAGGGLALTEEAGDGGSLTVEAGEGGMATVILVLAAGLPCRRC